MFDSGLHDSPRRSVPGSLPSRQAVPIMARITQHPPSALLHGEPWFQRKSRSKHNHSNDYLNGLWWVYASLVPAVGTNPCECAPAPRFPGYGAIGRFTTTSAYGLSREFDHRHSPRQVFGDFRSAGTGRCDDTGIRAPRQGTLLSYFPRENPGPDPVSCGNDRPLQKPGSRQAAIVGSAAPAPSRPVVEEGQPACAGSSHPPMIHDTTTGSCAPSSKLWVCGLRMVLGARP